MVGEFRNAQPLRYITVTGTVAPFWVYEEARSNVPTLESQPETWTATCIQADSWTDSYLDRKIYRQTDRHAGSHFNIQGLELLLGILHQLLCKSISP